MNWDLTRLYSSFSDPALHSDLASASEAAQKLIEMFSSESASVSDGLTLASSAVSEISKAGAYIMLTIAADATNAEALAFYDKLSDIEIELNRAMSAFTRYVGSHEITETSEIIDTHKYVLESMRRDAAHTIAPEIEPWALKLQKTGGDAWSQLQNQLTATLRVDIETDGEKKALPLSAVRGMASSPDVRVRRAAYEAELAAYSKIELAAAASLNSIKGEAITMCELRHFDTVLDTALDAARIDRATLDAMLSAMRESLPDFRRYFRLKAKALGYSGGLPFYEMFAPLGKSARKYTLDDAKKLLVEVLGAFSPDMGSMIARAFEERLIDAFPREGKSGGAFCEGVYAISRSYVLTNFEGSLASVSTIAHELGHAYHDLRLQENPILNATAPMTLAETASIFNETMLVDTLRQTAVGDERLMLLDQQISDAAQVIVDILSRFIFESEVISRRADHAMQPGELNEIMLAAQRETYGDGLDENFLHPYMWACKSHYYSTGLHFYNFPYAFGLLFGLGVYARYREKGASFLLEYDKLLRSTGLGDAKDIAGLVGIDVTDINFWRSSLGVIKGLIDEMEKIVR